MIKLNKLIGLKEKLFNERGEIENNNKWVNS
jgi:hypothetical protein